MDKLSIKEAMDGVKELKSRLVRDGDKKNPITQGYIQALQTLIDSTKKIDVLERIKDIIAQPPDRISHITIESYEKIRQAIFQAIADFHKEGI